MDIPEGSSALIIQPDSDAAKQLAGQLEEAGVRVKVSGSIDDGIRLADEATDVIILAIEPGKEGTGQCRLLRTEPATRHIPLLALASSPLEEDELGVILSAGAMDVLAPPMSQALLLARVGNMVRIHQEEAHLKETEERYRRIFNSSHYGYFLSTREGRFVEVNDSLLHILGYRS
jgi:DNA-binding response OmpR family regulator